MYFSDEQKRMLEGEHGRGAQKALNMLVKYGEAFGAEHCLRGKGAGQYAESDGLC